MTLLILDKTAHRDKAPMNAMIAKGRGNMREQGKYLTLRIRYGEEESMASSRKAMALKRFRSRNILSL